jgi:hypothetical protein
MNTQTPPSLFAGFKFGKSLQSFVVGQVKAILLLFVRSLFDSVTLANASFNSARDACQDRLAAAAASDKLFFATHEWSMFAIFGNFLHEINAEFRTFGAACVALGPKLFVRRRRRRREGAAAILAHLSG